MHFLNETFLTMIDSLMDCGINRKYATAHVTMYTTRELVVRHLIKKTPDIVSLAFRFSNLNSTDVFKEIFKDIYYLVEDFLPDANGNSIVREHIKDIVSNTKWLPRNILSMLLKVYSISHEPYGEITQEVFYTPQGALSFAKSIPRIKHLKRILLAHFLTDQPFYLYRSGYIPEYIIFTLERFCIGKKFNYVYESDTVLDEDSDATSPPSATMVYDTPFGFVEVEEPCVSTKNSFIIFRNLLMRKYNIYSVSYIIKSYLDYLIDIGKLKVVKNYEKCEICKTNNAVLKDENKLVCLKCHCSHQYDTRYEYEIKIFNKVITPIGSTNQYEIISKRHYNYLTRGVV